MLVPDLFRLATRMFRTNRSRTILTILGIGVGIGTILFLVSLGYGLQRVILSQITTSDALLSLDVTISDLDGISLNKESVEKIGAIQQVEIISPLVSMSAQMKSNDVSSEVIANFVDSNFFRLDGTTLKDGDFYGENEKNKVIVSLASLQLFSIAEDEAIGKKINFSAYKETDKSGVRELVELGDDFEIVGIADDENSSFVYLPYSLVEIIGDVDFSKIKVKVDKEENLEIVRAFLIDENFLVSALSDIIEQANQIFNVAKIVLALFGVIALIVSAIGMFNTMTIALLERTQEIGIMKALGATSLDIWEMFLSESVIIGFTGGVSGILIGMLGGEIFNNIINMLAGAYGGDKIDLFYTPIWFITTVTIFSTVVGLATGFYPAKRAASISALVALRYK
ncbi:MAG: ABC transporter permease [Patescibacteria group bacterium]|jgi:putative ABC transport system permease protein|nr:ABC transporter permease [Patescibacteria group bacterium]